MPGALTASASPTLIEPSDVRYIKLGRGGGWVDCSLDAGEIHFGFSDAPHDMASRADLEELRAFYLNQGRPPGVASSFAREIIDFYTQPATTLWITLARERLWYCFAEPEVVPLGEGQPDHGARKRHTIDGWRCVDVHGTTLTTDSLSSRLTKTAAYRATICKVEAREYLVRRLNGLVEPAVASAEEARKGLSAAVEALVRGLHWRDFEMLVDLIFARLGWYRISVLGETMADIDMVVEQPATGEKGVVQIKSRSSQKEVNEFWAAVADGGFARHWLVVHTDGHKLAPPSREVTIWTVDRVADATVRAGLVDWLLDRCR